MKTGWETATLHLQRHDAGAIASGHRHDGNKPPAKTVSNQPNSNAKMATEEERAKIMAEYLAGADEDDGLGDFDPDDEVRT